MSGDLWERCLPSLQSEFPAQQYNTWIRPLSADESQGSVVVLLAPNRFVETGSMISFSLVFGRLFVMCLAISVWMSA